MIAPMKKVSLLIRSEEKVRALTSLRALGLLHIEIEEGSGERLLEIKEQLTLLEAALFTVGENAVKGIEQKAADTEVSLELAGKAAALSEEKKALLSKIPLLSAEVERLHAWGEVSPEELTALGEKGITLIPYEMPKKEYKRLSNELKTVLVSDKKSTVRFLLLGEPSEELSAFRVELPKESTVVLKKRIAEKQERIAEINSKLGLISAYYGSFKSAIGALGAALQFETYSTGMDEQELSERSGNIAYFKGYIPSEDLERLASVARENAWGIVTEDPSEEDDPPTKLENNKFVSLIYPLTDFLGTVPGYFEYDISAWFLGFILIFFGIIFGDGGYGLLITAVAAIPIIKSLIAKKSPAPTFLLVGLFGLSTVLWGTLTCTWFGLAPEQLPEWLCSLSVPFISNVNADRLWQPFWVSGDVGLTTAQNLQIFCFSLALLQLTVAHIMGAARNRGSLKMLGDIGSILQLIGMYYVVLSFVVNGAVFPIGLTVGRIPVGIIAIVLVGIGFVTSFVFANFEGSVIKSLLESLKNIVSVLLGVVNVFSDIVSYIRLWAVGLAGAAISATVNELAGPLLGNFLFMVLAIVLLVFGHGLNMILNVLSVIVHGIRLNTLEFSSHLDMSWSGHKYKPFEE